MLHKALRLIRVFHDLKAAELAAKLKVSRSYLSEIERGKKRPTLELIGKYSKAFNLPASTIVYFGEALRPRRGMHRLFEIESKEKAVAFMRLTDRFKEVRP